MEMFRRYSSYSSSSNGRPTNARIRWSNLSFSWPDLVIRPRLSNNNLVLNGERVERGAALPEGVTLYLPREIVSRNPYLHSLLLSTSTPARNFCLASPDALVQNHVLVMR